VEVFWSLEAERALEQELPRRARQEVVASHDFGDPVVGVVQHHGQLVRRCAITAADQEIAHAFRHVEHLRRCHAVVHLDAAGFHHETDAHFLAGAHPRVIHGSVASPAGARVATFQNTLLRSAECGADLGA
jgi:hypothetical protein